MLSILDLNGEFDKEVEEISRKRTFSEIVSDEEEISWVQTAPVYIPETPPLVASPEPEDNPEEWSQDVVDAVENWCVEQAELAYLVSLYEGDSDVDDDPLCFQDR